MSDNRINCLGDTEEQLQMIEKRATYDMYVDAYVRYWEDGSINGMRDISFEEQKKGIAPKMPFAEKSESGDYRWYPKINLNVGYIYNWPKDCSAHIHYKVCDEGIYTLADGTGNIIDKKECYVPSILAPHDESFGDYIILNINENGYVENWWNGQELMHEIGKFCDTESF